MTVVYQTEFQLQISIIVSVDEYTLIFTEFGYGTQCVIAPEGFTNVYHGKEKHLDSDNLVELNNNVRLINNFTSQEIFNNLNAFHNIITSKTNSKSIK